MSFYFHSEHSKVVNISLNICSSLQLDHFLLFTTVYNSLNAHFSHRHSKPRFRQGLCYGEIKNEEIGKSQIQVQPHSERLLSDFKLITVSGVVVMSEKWRDGYT